jgi:hypothetical protein
MMVLASPPEGTQRWINRRPRPGMVNFGVVNGGASYYLPAAKFAIYRDFTPKSRLQKVR